MTTEKFDKAYQNTFMNGMHTLRQNEGNTDVKLQSGDTQIRCHRNVLAVATDYFEAMFRCGLEESTSATVPLIMEPEILTCMVDYMYTGEIELTVDNVESLFKAGDVFELDIIKEACQNFMLKQIEPVNCVGFYKFATLYRLDPLQKKAMQFILAEFKTVAFNAEFKALSCRELLEFIKNDDVNVEDEDIVFDAVLGWIRHDLDNRKTSMRTILEHVRLPYCTSNYLSQTKDVYDLLTPKCFEYLLEAMSFQLDPLHQQEIASCRTVPRTNFRKKSCLLVVGGLTLEGQNNVVVENNQCLYYKLDTNCWESQTTLPRLSGRLYNVCRVAGGMVLTGGVNWVAMDKCWLYDFAAKKWEVMPNLTTARYNHRSVSLGDSVYVLGGQGVDKQELTSVECLAMTLNQRQWLSMPEMPHAASSPAVGKHKNKIFVFGGTGSQNKALCYIQVFDTTRRQWSILSDMPEVCSYGAAVTLNDCIYVVGGHNRTCLKYDPALDDWTQLNRPSQDHGNAPAVVWRGSILVAGGGGAKPESYVIEQYNPLTNTWSEWSTTLDVKRECHCLFNVDL